MFKYQTIETPNNLYYFFSVFLLISSFIILPLISTNIGIPADEPIDLEYGIQSLNYFKSEGKDMSFAELKTYKGKYTVKTQKYYGALIEMSTAKLGEILPFDIFKIRHFCMGIIGALIILFTTLTSTAIGNWKLGLTTLLLMVISAPFIGQAMYNTKDIPFALGFTISTYFIIRFYQLLPKIKPRVLIGLTIGIAIAIAIGIRIGAILLIPYFGFFFILSTIKYFKSGKKFYVKEIIKPWFLLLIASFIGIFIGLLFYPNFYVEKTKHVVDAWIVAKNFPVKILSIYEGQQIWSTQAPKTYLLKNILISFPLIILSGILLFIVFSKTAFSKSEKYILVFLLFVSFFPTLYITFSHANVYNGWRHISFSYPPIVIISSIGIYTLLNKIKNKKVIFYPISIIIIIFMIKPFVWMIKNHPYEYIYFNELTGKDKGYMKYDTDYQQLGSSESYLALVKHLQSHKSSNIKYPVKLYTNNEAMIYQDALPEDSLKIIIGGFSGLSYKDWDFAIMSSIFLKPKLFKYTFPPSGKIIHKVKVDNYPINYLVQRENKFDIEGIQYLNKKDINNAYRVHDKFPFSTDVCS